MREVGKEDWIGKYDIELTKVMSAETSDISDDLMASISLSEALKNLLDGQEGVETKELTRVIIKDILDLADKFPTLFKGGEN